jgi:MerR family transcriptional regulator/heat shock protein HspR
MKKSNTMDESAILIPIGSMAMSLKTDPRTLRIYDKEGILVPARSSGKTRYYTLEDKRKAEVIFFLTRNLLLNLSAVKVIFKLLEKQKIKPKNYLSYIEKIAFEAGFSDEIQNKNIQKNRSRGREPEKKSK